jgi:hypothetical protein
MGTTGVPSSANPARTPLWYQCSIILLQKHKYASVTETPMQASCQLHMAELQDRHIFSCNSWETISSHQQSCVGKPMPGGVCFSTLNISKKIFKCSLDPKIEVVFWFSCGQTGHFTSVSYEGNVRPKRRVHPVCKGCWKVATHPQSHRRSNGRRSTLHSSVKPSL